MAMGRTLAISNMIGGLAQNYQLFYGCLTASTHLFLSHFAQAYQRAEANSSLHAEYQQVGSPGTVAEPWLLDAPRKIGKKTVGLACPVRELLGGFEFPVPRKGNEESHIFNTEHIYI